MPNFEQVKLPDVRARLVLAEARALHAGESGEADACAIARGIVLALEAEPYLAGHVYHWLVQHVADWQTGPSAPTSRSVRKP